MTDIVERLRYMATVEGREVAAEAADEIERLRSGIPEAVAIAKELYLVDHHYASEIETLREEVALWQATGIDPRMGIRPTGWKWPQENLS